MRRRAILALLIQAGCRPVAPEGRELTPEELAELLEKRDDVFFLDVREPAEIGQLGSVPGYVNIPLSQLARRLEEIPRDKVIVTLWTRGNRAARAADMLRNRGFKVVGSCGVENYKRKGGKVVYPRQEGARWGDGPRDAGRHARVEAHKGRRLAPSNAGSPYFDPHPDQHVRQQR